MRGDAFRGMDALGAVHLYGNSLTTLEVNSFTGLPRDLLLSLGGNPFDCTTGALCWLRQSYVTLMATGNQGSTLECAGGESWDSIDCPEIGRTTPKQEIASWPKLTYRCSCLATKSVRQFAKKKKFLLNGHHFGYLDNGLGQATKLDDSAF